MSDRIELKEIDRSNMRELLQKFPEQFEVAYRIGSEADIKLDRAKIRNVIFAGMGGSAIGGDVIIDIVKKQLFFPAAVNRNYYLPPYVDNSTLVVISSFSGNTEESLSSFEDAKNKGAQILCITSGGKLYDLAHAHGYPVIRIPGGMPPRCALGYLSVPVLKIFAQNNIFSIKEREFEATISLLKELSALYCPDSSDNLALATAQNLIGKIPVIYSSADFLFSAAMRWKGQFSENAKVLAFANFFPELNHNEIVGWEQHPDLLKKFQLIYLQDDTDHPRNQTRMEITKSILENVTNPILVFKPEGKSRLEKLFSIIYLGDWISYYLAILNRVDPTPIQKIEILKNELSKI